VKIRRVGAALAKDDRGKTMSYAAPYKLFIYWKLILLLAKDDRRDE